MKVLETSTSALMAAAVSGAAHKLKDPSEAALMAAASAERHSGVHVLSDTVYDELAHPMDSVPSDEYRKGVQDALQLFELALSEHDSLREVRDEFPDGIEIEVATSIGNIVLPRIPRR